MDTAGLNNTTSNQYIQRNHLVRAAIQRKPQMLSIQQDKVQNAFDAFFRVDAIYRKKTKEEKKTEDTRKREQMMQWARKLHYRRSNKVQMVLPLVHNHKWQRI
ncbi:hypothetical protein [Paenibacillus allorhizoplanae]|uniref:hypothetical protein n=1 Tax=Paenibacillus allorhizoplanae TaxID=2905648 RepID=UPI001F2DA9DE|nr:hypothetical protein [Paenibacillus allorhizoplanae]